MTKWQLVIMAVVGVFVILGGSLATASWALRPPLPSNIRKSATFVIWFPKNSDVWHLKDGSVKYDKQAKLLSFVMQSPGNAVTVSEQSAPEQFTDVPQLYGKVLEQMKQYTSLDSAVGTVALTRPDNLKGGQTAVWNTKGTLVFARPDKNMETDEWRTVLNQFEQL